MINRVTMLPSFRPRFANSTPTPPPAPDAGIPLPKGKEAFTPYSKYVKITSPLATAYDRKHIDTNEVTVLDLETTGLEAKPDFKKSPKAKTEKPDAEKPNKPPEEESLDDIIEISAIKYTRGVGGTGKKRFYRLVKPFKPIPKFLEEKTGITNERIQKEGVDPRQALTELATFLGPDSLRVGHNGKMFDNRMLRAYAKRLGLEHLRDTVFRYETVVDTLDMAAKLFPDTKKKKPLQPGEKRPANLKLNTVAEFFGIINPGAHQAENDVTTAAQLYYRMVDEIRQRGIPLKTFGDLFKFQFSPHSVPVELLPEGHPQKQ